MSRACLLFHICATLLKVFVCQPPSVRTARCLEDAGEAEDFKAFLEDRTFDSKLADEKSPMWCPWLAFASPPTPPQSPKTSAFVTDAQGNRVVSEGNAVRSPEGQVSLS